MPRRWPWAPTPWPPAIAAEAARRGIAIKLVRNGSRGMVWLEPLVEVATPRGRIAYGPVAPAEVPGLFAAGFLDRRRPCAVPRPDRRDSLAGAPAAPGHAGASASSIRVRWPTTSRAAAARACAAHVPWRRPKSSAP
jgi:hypothetical protein